MKWSILAWIGLLVAIFGPFPVIWQMFSVFVMLAGVGAVLFFVFLERSLDRDIDDGLLATAVTWSFLWMARIAKDQEQCLEYSTVVRKNCQEKRWFWRILARVAAVLFLCTFMVLALVVILCYWPSEWLSMKLKARKKSE